MLFKKFWFVFIFGLVIGLLLAFIGFQGVESTSSVSFCSKCHEMKPLYETWLKGPHGPFYESNKHTTLKNLFHRIFPHGPSYESKGAVRATCVDCHLPPSDNLANYLVNKGISGTRDLFVHFLGRPSKIDWVAKLDESKKFVFDKSCLKCHLSLPTCPLTNNI